MNNSKKALNIFKEVKKLNNIIKEKMVAEAIVTNKNCKFMNEQEFENIIRQLDSFEISKAMQGINMWYLSKLQNQEIEKMGQDKNDISNNEILKMLN